MEKTSHIITHTVLIFIQIEVIYQLKYWKKTLNIEHKIILIKL